MKEQGIFFTTEQRNLLEEILKLENSELNAIKDSLKTSGMPEGVFIDERKKLTVMDRIKIAESIQSKYSILKKQKSIFSEQLFSAMEDYLKECEKTGRRYEGL